jgi:hypothetical protein
VCLRPVDFGLSVAYASVVCPCLSVEVKWYGASNQINPCCRPHPSDNCAKALSRDLPLSLLLYHGSSSFHSLTEISPQESRNELFDSDAVTNLPRISQP